MNKPDPDALTRTGTWPLMPSLDVLVVSRRQLAIIEVLKITQAEFEAALARVSVPR